MRIGVLGATGMLGHHTALAIAAGGDEPVLFHRAGAALERVEDVPGARVVADLDDPQSLTRAFAVVDAVVHCAGYYPGAPRPLRDEIATAERQIGAFLEACQRTRLQRAVYVGSSIALRRNPDGSPGHEGLIQISPPATRNPYVRVKWLLDHRCAEWAARGLDLSIAIPALTLGEFDYGPSTGQLVTMIANRRMPAYVRGNRNVVYAGDAARGIYRVLQSGLRGERYLLTGANVSMDELVGEIAQLTGSPRPRPVPLSAARAVAGLQTLRYRYANGPLPRISETAIAIMSGGQFLSGDKAFNALRYTPETILPDTLRRTLDWFRRLGYIPGELREDDASAA